jgi:hypothetical protein
LAKPSSFLFSDEKHKNYFNCSFSFPYFLLFETLDYWTTMMKTLGLLFLLSTAVNGFVIPKQATTTTHTRTTRISMVGTVIMETEDDARFILSRAKLCAYDPDCSVEDAEIMLNEMLHVQSGCAMGTLVGHDLCEEQDVAADVVAHLREKVRMGREVITKFMTKP